VALASDEGLLHLLDGDLRLPLGQKTAAERRAARRTRSELADIGKKNDGVTE
jgi:hypothetical protein